VVCAVSKPYQRAAETEYWYAFHPAQLQYLDGSEDAFVAYGCGDPSTVILLPANFFKPLLPGMWTTETSARMYWHIHIFEAGGKFFLQQGKLGTRTDVTKYRIQKN